MKRLNLKMKKFLYLLIIYVFFNVFTTDVILKQTKAESYCEAVLAVDGGRILYENRSMERRPIASTTKIITAFTVIKNYDLKKQITVKKEWTGIEGSSVYLKEGETFTVEELLYGLMLRSGNDCAVTLACALAGSKKAFAEKMNDLAKECGATSSHFVNPHGLHDDEHYSTAYDLALITAKALKTDEFAKIVSTKKFTAGGEEPRVWINKNKLLFNYEFATGVKTGYTKKAGRCLVSSAEKNGFKVVCVVLDCPPMFERSKELLESAFKKYKNVLLASKDRAVATVPVGKTNVYLPLYVKEDIYYPLTNDELYDVQIKILPDEIKRLPVKFCKECGSIKIYLKKQLLFDEKIFTII